MPICISKVQIMECLGVTQVNLSGSVVWPNAENVMATTQFNFITNLVSAIKHPTVDYSGVTKDCQSSLKQGQLGVRTLVQVYRCIDCKT